MGIGQGTVFAAQTWLLAQGRFALLSTFSAHYAVSTLAVLVVDSGASTILARETARTGMGAAGDIWSTFSETSLFRSLLAGAVGAAAAAYALGVTPDAFSRNYLLFCLPGWLIWSCNGGGLLDGLKLSGLGGLCGAITYAASAGALLLGPPEPTASAGVMLGGAFSIGCGLTVAAQWAALTSAGQPPRLRRVTAAGLRRAARDGVALLFQLLPGQLNSRGALLLSAAYLGAETTAVFAYVKQLIIALATIIVFLLRIDFPALVQKLSLREHQSFLGIFSAQKITLYCSLIMTLGAVVIALAASAAPASNFSRAASLLLLFAPTVLTASLSMMLVQGLAALGAYLPMARIVTLSAVLGITASYVFIDVFGIYALLAGELLFHFAGFSLAYIEIRRLRFW